METTNKVVPMQPQKVEAPKAVPQPINEEASHKSSVHDIRQREGYFYIGDFGGKQRFVKFDLNAFAEMESIYGSMDEAQDKLAGGHMKDIRTVLWLGLIHDEANLDPITGEPISYNLSQYQVGGWLTTLNIKDVMAKLQEAISGSMPDDATAATMNADAAATTNDSGETPNQ